VLYNCILAERREMLARFVTGLVDSKLHGKRKTMFQRATDLGLPASFVEIRHEATHRELPSLVVLRSNTHRSLEWLWGFYWCKLDTNLALLNYSQLGMAKSPATTTGTDQNLRSKIRNYVLKLHGIDRGEQTQIAKRKEARRLGLFLSQPLVTICRGYHEGCDVLIQVLLEKNLVLPVQRP
jgi:ribosomal biogenesis protein LAS1